MRELIIDSFAGGGGASTGILQALGRHPDVAINHDPEAIAMHAANHPSTRHFCQSVYEVDPVAVTGGHPVGLFWASPDCKDFSKAKGSAVKRSKEIRDLAWVVVRYAQAVRPRVIILENVEEFAGWGPLHRQGPMEGQRIKARRGQTFRQWGDALRALGYVVEWRELRACDYGAPTIRKRLFVVARRDGRPIVWPEPTHGPADSLEVGAGLRTPWRSAAECIDWSIPCPSIFERSKPLAEATLRRIALGVVRYVLLASRPFIVPVAHAGDSRVHSVEDPLRTVTAGRRGDFALVTPFVSSFYGNNGHGGDLRGHGLEEPLRTQPTENRHALIAPTLIQTGYGERPGQAPRVPGLEKPLGTVVAGGAKHAVVSAHLLTNTTRHPGGPAEKPLATITTQGNQAVVAAYLAQHNRGAVGHDASEPVSTVTSTGSQQAVVAAHLTHFYGSGSGEGDPLAPLKTVTTGGWHAGLVSTLLKEYAGRPHAEFVTVEIDEVLYVIADIGMRMLTPSELFRAQGFPEDYVIDPVVNGKSITKTAQVRCCGNSVCPPLAAALARANVPDMAITVEEQAV